MKKNISLMLVLVMLATVLVGCGGGDTYEDGTYTGEATGMEPLTVEVTVEDGKISNVEVIEENETEGFAEPALENIPKAIVDANSTDVDVESGATITSEAIMDAVDNALQGE